MQSRRSVAPLLVLLSMPSCGGNDADSTANERETLIAVSPEEFLGAVPCMSGPGSMTRYVATLIDVTEENSAEAAGTPARVEFELPSAGPVSCKESIAFGHVDEGRSYSAQIDGYASQSIEPLSPGSPTMIDRETGAIVSPQWSTRCGDPDQVGLNAPAIAIYRMTVTVRGCAPMVASTAPTGTVLLPLGTTLAEAGTTCDDLASLSVVDGESPVMHDVPLDCNTALEVAGLSTGEHKLVVSTTTRNGDAGPTLTCEANVPASGSTTAECQVAAEPLEP